MSDFLEVACPECKTILIVNRRDGKIVEVRKPLIEDSTGDRFEDATRKVKREKETIARKFEEAKKRESEKMDRLNAIFEEGLKKARKEGPIEKPFNPMELD